MLPKDQSTKHQDLEAFSDAALEEQSQALGARAEILRQEVRRATLELSELDSRGLAMGEVLAKRKVQRDTAPDWGWLLEQRPYNYSEGYDVRGRALIAALRSFFRDEEASLLTSFERNHTTGQTQLYISLRDSTEESRLTLLYALGAVLPYIKLGLPDDIAGRKNSDIFKAVKHIGVSLAGHWSYRTVGYLAINETKKSFEFRIKEGKANRSIFKVESLEKLLERTSSFIADQIASAPAPIESEQDFDD